MNNFPGCVRVSEENRWSVGDYISKDVGEDHNVPDKVLLKYLKALDIVTKNHKQSCCFTKAYTHYADGTGSVLQQVTSKSQMLHINSPYNFLKWKNMVIMMWNRILSISFSINNFIKLKFLKIFNGKYFKVCFDLHINTLVFHYVIILFNNFYYDFFRFFF